MIQNFDEWNTIKKKIDAKQDTDADKFPKEGEVWICLLGKNVGWEQNGTGIKFSRPILILKTFNKQMFWGIPLSSKQKDLDFYYNFTDTHNRKVSAILAQIKLISTKRLDRKIYVLDKMQLLVIKSKLKSML